MELYNFLSGYEVLGTYSPAVFPQFLAVAWPLYPRIGCLLVSQVLGQTEVATKPITWPILPQATPRNPRRTYITGYGHSTNRPGHHGTVVARTVGSNASCHSHSLENATHLAGTGVQVLIYMGQMQPASSSIRWSVDARCDSHTDFHLQQKIEYKSGFHGNDYKKVVYLV